MKKSSLLYRLYVVCGIAAMNAYRGNPFRSRFIAFRQSGHMARIGAENTPRAIVFLTPGRDSITGGVMSIINLARETRQLFALHGAREFVCTMPGDPPLLRYTKFVNDRTLLDFAALCETMRAGAEVLVHVPEVYTARFAQKSEALLASGRHRWRFNILLQNIDLIPRKEDVAALARYGPVTATTAHYAYSGAKTEAALGCPVHHLNAWTSTTAYEVKPFAERKNIVIVSPDEHEGRDALLAELKRRMPEFRFVTIARMTYPAYRKLIASAKFSLTFGEGFDAYFSEMVWSGGIGCAVYNERFFTPDFAALPFIYPSWQELARRLPEDLRAVDAPEPLARENARIRAVLDKYSSLDITQANLAQYYRKFFSCAPDTSGEMARGK